MQQPRGCLKGILSFLLFTFFTVTGYGQQQLPVPDWVKDIGGAGESKVSGVAVDKFDNVYVAGNFRGNLTVDLSGVSSPVNLTTNGDYDLFIAKYTADGKLLWAKSLGGGGLDQINNLTVDKDGNPIFAISFSSSSIDCDPGPGTFNINSSGSEDAAMIKLTTDGDFVWARQLGSGDVERGHVVTTDALGNVIFVGSFSSTINLGTVSLTSRGALDGFITKYDSAGNLLWAYGLGSDGDDEIKNVKINSNNEIALIGYFNGSSIDLNPKGAPKTMTGGFSTYFICKYSANGDLIWGNKIDGTEPTVSSIATGPGDDFFITGVYRSNINFNSPGNTVSLNTGQKNLFVAKYSGAGNTLWAKDIKSNGSNPYSYYLTADVDDNIYIGGYFDGVLTFGETGNTKSLSTHGSTDTFFGKFDKTGAFIWAFNIGSSCGLNYGHKIAVDSKKNVILGGKFCGSVDFNPAGNCDLIINATDFISDGFLAKYNQIKLTGDPLITAFSLAAQTAPATIDIVNKKISISVVAGTDISKLIPQITTDIGTLTPLSGIETDFTNPKTYTVSSNCVSYQWVVTVTVKDCNIVNVISADQTGICNGGSVIISGSEAPAGTPAYAYKWQQSINDTDWADIPNKTNKDLVITAPGQSFSFRRIASAGTCQTFSNAIRISLFQPVSNASAGADQSLCNTSTLTLNAQPAAANETGSWSVLSPLDYNPFNPANIHDPKAVVNEIPGNKQVELKWTVKHNICQTESFSTVKIYRYIAPAVSLLGNMTVSEGQSVRIPATLNPGQTGPYTYSWTPAGDVDNPNILAPIVSPANTKIYTLKVSYGTGCESFYNIKIIVDKTTKMQVCSATGIRLSGDIIENGQSAYQWQVLDGAVWKDLANGSERDYEVPANDNTGTTTLIYTYRRAVSEPGDDRYYDSKYEVSVFSKITSNTISTAITHFCEPPTENIEIAGTIPLSSAGNSFLYTWEKSADGINWQGIAGNSVKNLSVNSLSGTSYFRRKVKAGDCENISESLKITVSPPPTLALAGDDKKLCGETSVILNANEPAENETGTWKVISPLGYNPFTASTQHDPRVTLTNIPQNKALIFSWSIENQTCATASSDEVQIISYQEPVVTVPDLTSINFGEKINLGIKAGLSPDQNYTFDWSPKTGLSSYTTLSPDASPADNTVYTLTISYGDNCIKKTTVSTIVIKEIGIPNTFSPNSDGINDLWNIKNIGNYPKSKVSVFNRHGMLIYQSLGKVVSWDGTYKGSRLPTGVYFYLIEIKDEKNRVMQGSITLLN